MKPNEQKPTAYQIEAGQLIIPKKFYQMHEDVLRGEFTAVAFGTEVPKRKLDQSKRVRVPLKDHVQPGQTVALRMDDGVLFIEAGGER